jgi:hypothetical protein
MGMMDDNICSNTGAGKCEETSYTAGSASDEDSFILKRCFDHY